MGWESVAREVGVEDRVLSALSDEDILVRLEEILEGCETLEPMYGVEEDRAPVLKSDLSYWARLDHLQQKIVINGHRLDESLNRSMLRRFLVWHELFHAWVESLGQTELWSTFGMKEESAADLLACYALQCGLD